jgi:hypothetical protein
MGYYKEMERGDYVHYLLDYPYVFRHYSPSWSRSVGMDIVTYSHTYRRPRRFFKDWLLPLIPFSSLKSKWNYYSACLPPVVGSTCTYRYANLDVLHYHLIIPYLFTRQRQCNSTVVDFLPLNLRSKPILSICRSCFVQCLRRFVNEVACIQLSVPMIYL